MTALALLPPGATAWETSVSLASAARRPLDSDIIRRVWSPADCPTEFLPYLAHAFSVDLWDEKWSEQRKRAIIDESVSMHRLKGTQKGIERYLFYVDASLRKAIRPPARGYHRAAVTPESWATWLDAQPQIRIFPFANFGTVAHSGKKFYRRFHGRLASHPFQGRGFLCTSRGTKLYGRTAFLFQNGVQTAVGLEPVTEPGVSYDRVYLTAVGSKRAYHGHGFVRPKSRFRQASIADQKTLTIRVDYTGGPMPTLLAPSMRPIDVLPARVVQVRTPPVNRSFHTKLRPRWRRWSQTSAAPLLIYDRIALLDPTKGAQRRKVRGFHGYKRFGIDAFTAQLTLDIPMRRPRSRLNRFHVGYVKKADMTPLQNALTALHRAKSLRDTLLVDTIVYRRVRLKDHLKLGQFRLGQIIKVA
jgi:phage tail-like protein